MYSFTTTLLCVFPHENKIGVLTLEGSEWQYCLGQFSVIHITEDWKKNNLRQIGVLWNYEVKNRSEKSWQLDPTWICIISLRNIIQTTFLPDSRLTKVYCKALKITWIVILLCFTHFSFKECTTFLKMYLHSYWSYWMGKTLHFKTMVI